MSTHISKCFGVYQIRNLINDKIYVGSTSCSFKTRWASWRGDLRNKRTRNKHLQNAWDKYGEENFSFEILEIIENKDQVLEREQYWIDKLNCVDKTIGYNICPVAGSPMVGRVHLEETKKNIALRQKGRRKNSRPNCKCGNPVKEHYTKKGRFHSYYKTCGNIECIKHFTPCSEETKKKISEANIKAGRKPSFKGYNHTEETKAKLREIGKITSVGRRHTEATKEKLRQALRGNKNGAKVKGQ